MERSVLTEARRRVLLRYCKLEELKDDPEVVDLIPLFFSDAVGYLAGAGVQPPGAEETERGAQYDLLVNRMVLDSWDHRDAQEGDGVRESIAFRRALNQLKLSEPVSDSDTLF